MSGRIKEITGKIVLEDGSVSEFEIVSDGEWQQWGATFWRLGETVQAIEAMQRVLVEEELLVGEEDEEVVDR